MDILGPAISVFMKEDVQLVILGRGRPQYEELVEKVEANYPGRAVAIIGFDNALAHLAYAGSDIFLMPSRFEPCGLGQLIAMRYGSVPVVRRTGGLAETVTDVTGDLSAGSGFVFDEYSPEALAAAVKRALAAYRSSPDAWRGLVRRIMKLDFSWQNSARKYAAVYRRALGGNRRGTR
jgi:starch synthase